MEDKKYNLFLDDYRYPDGCQHTNNPIYNEIEWEIVRNYGEFVKYITENGLPELVSFDHDLAEAHYHPSMWKGAKLYMQYLETTSEKTGMDCAKWLVDYCIDNGKPFPKWLVHSMNPVGKENITAYISNYLKHVETVA